MSVQRIKAIFERYGDLDRLDALRAEVKLPPYGFARTLDFPISQDNGLTGWTYRALNEYYDRVNSAMFESQRELNERRAILNKSPLSDPGVLRSLAIAAGAVGVYFWFSRR